MNLIEKNMGMVKRLAKRHCRNFQDFEDLVQTGIVGLLEAKERFNPVYGTKFLTYATYWIEKRIREFVYHKGCNTITSELDEEKLSAPEKSIDSQIFIEKIFEAVPSESKKEIFKKYLKQEKQNVSKQRVHQVFQDFVSVGKDIAGSKNEKGV